MKQMKEIQCTKTTPLFITNQATATMATIVREQMNLYTTRLETMRLQEITLSKMTHWPPES